MFELFSVELVRQYLSRSSVSFWRQQKSSAKFCQLTWKNMMFHYFGFHYVTCPQPLDLPCACDTFKKPVPSIGSVESFVFSGLQFPRRVYEYSLDHILSFPCRLDIHLRHLQKSYPLQLCLNIVFLVSFRLS